jgi:TatD DNase family protein
MTGLINIHTHHKEKPEDVFSVVNVTLPRFNVPHDCYFSVGWHPWYINGVPLRVIESTLIPFLQHKKLVALGESGLDRTIGTPLQFQTEVFDLHVKLASRVGKPLIVHCVKAYSDLLHYLKEVNPETRLIIHGYNANRHITNQLLNYNTFFSIGKEVLNPKTKIAGILKTIPRERIFFETDEAGFSVSEIYMRAAQIVEIPVTELAEQVRQNFNKVFGNGLIEGSI